MAEVVKAFYSAQDLIVMLGVSRAAAYKLIKEMNEELSQDGYHTIKGKVSKRYLDEKLYLID